eukprot:8986646-Pyramimonas_sp.AAC.1
MEAKFCADGSEECRSEYGFDDLVDMLEGPAAEGPMASPAPDETSLHSEPSEAHSHDHAHSHSHDVAHSHSHDDAHSHSHDDAHSEPHSHSHGHGHGHGKGGKGKRRRAAHSHSHGVSGGVGSDVFAAHEIPW